MPTSRLEAFSDGVFAIAITLLVLDLRTPNAEPGRLAHALLHEWPSYAAYTVTFLLIGILWVNHHAVFRFIETADRTLLFLNLLLLMSVSVLPFPTSLYAKYIDEGASNAHVAAFVYSLCMTFVAITFNLTWWYASHHPELFGHEMRHPDADLVLRQGLIGGALYAATMAISWITAPGTLAVHAALACFFAFGYRPERMATDDAVPLDAPGHRHNQGNQND